MIRIKIPSKSAKTLLILFTLAAFLGAALYATALENQVTALTVSPNPIKLGTTAYIQFNLGQASQVSIAVYKDSGEQVRTIWNKLSKAAGTYLQSWDGKDNAGLLVPDGNYRIAVEAIDTTGNQVGYAEQTVKAARQPAISGVAAAPNPFNPALGEQLSINYTLSSDAKVTVTVIKDYAVIRTLAQDQLQTAGGNTITWDGKDNAGNIVSDGPVTYQIDATSPTEPTFKSTYKGTATVEKDNPRITGFSAMPIPFKIAGGNMSISYSLSEDAKVTMKVVDSAGAAVRTILNAVAKKAGYNSSTWDGKNDASGYVPEGTYYLVVSAVDAANKTSGEQSITFKAGYQPAISGVSISPSVFNPTDPATPTTSVSYSISSDALVTVEVFNGYNKVRTLAAGQYQSAGAQTIIWDGRDDAGNILGDADYSVQITAVSPTVDSFYNTYKGTVTVEKGAPSITGATVSPNPYKLGGTGNLSIMYNLSENSNVSINISRGAEAVRQLVTNQSKLAGFASATWDGRDNAGNSVPEGMYTVTIQATDKYGNSSQVQTNVTCGYQPAITNVSQTPGIFNPAEDGNAYFNFTLSNDAKVSLTIMNGSMPVRTISANTLAAGQQQLAWDGKDDSGKFVSDGSYNYQIDAVSPTVDIFKSTFKGIISVEGAGPQITDLSISPIIVKINSNATIRYTLSEPATISAQIVKAEDLSVVRDLPTETKATGGIFSITWDTKDNSGVPITTGSYILKLAALDSSGKTGASELTFHAEAVPSITSAYADPQNVDLAASSQTLIRFNLSEPSYVTVKIIDSTGTLIKTLCTYQEFASGQHSLPWDLTDSKGSTITGTFTFTIDAFSKLGNFRAPQVSGTISVTGNIITPTPSNCKDCHVGYPEPHLMSNCAGCHSNNQPIASVHSGTEDCASCHAAHDATPLLTYDCTYCHNDTYSYKIPYHPGDMNVLHTAPVTSDCTACHNAALNVEHPNYVNPATGRPYDCNTCHQSTVTEVVYAIDNGLKNCNACHVISGHTAVHTNPTFTALTKDADMDCALCHNSVLSDEHLARTDAAGASYTCDTCHGSAAPEAVKAAITNNNKNCEACHIDPATGQPTVHTESGSPLHDSVYVLAQDVNCQQCHAGNIKDGHVGKISSTTNQPMDCATCHKSNNPLVVMAITSKDTACNACHIYPTAKHQPIHQTNIYTTDTARSDAGTCATCHSTKNLTDLHVGKVNSATGQAMDCNTCHASADTKVVNAITTGETNSCEACHTVHAPKDATTVHNTTDVFTDSADTDCASCHDRNVKAEHIDKGRTINGVAMTCDSCHASTDPDVVNAINTNNTGCDACHAMPPAKHSPVHTASVFTSDTTRTDQATCSLCHVKVLPDQHVDKVTTAGVTMDCNTCHSSTAPDNVKIAVSTANDNCEACHTVHPVKSAITQHDSTDVYALNADVNCSGCHQRNIRAEHLDNPARTTSAGQPITCDTCHGSTNSVVQLAISAGNNKCDACHTYPTAEHRPVHATNVFTTDITRTDDCSMCHVKSLTDQHVGRTNSATGQAMDCNTCHASADTKVVNAISSGQTNSCEACHTVHPVRDVTQLHDSVTFTNYTYDPSMNCSSCHNSSLSAEHVNKTTEAGVTMNCDTCHKSTRPDVQSAIAANNLKCEACHTTVHTSPNPYHATTFVANPTMDCAKCHNAGSIADDHVQYKTSTGANINCDTCHKSTDTAVINAIRTGNTGCDTCHTARHTDIQTPHKTTYIPTSTWNCSNCHTASAIGYNLTASYHKIPGVTPTTGLLHGGTFVSPWTSTSDMNCRDCHNKNTSTNTYYGKLLKGAYTSTTGKRGYSTSNQLCFFCHSTTAYGPNASTGSQSGFYGDGKNLHAIGNHTEKGGCMSCHSDRPHSGSNKHLIVTKSTSEPNSQLTGYSHTTTYSKSSCATSCH